MGSDARERAREPYAVMKKRALKSSRGERKGVEGPVKIQSEVAKSVRALTKKEEATVEPAVLQVYVVI